MKTLIKIAVVAVSVASLSGGGLDNDEPESNSCLESVGPDEGNSSKYGLQLPNPQFPLN